MWDTFGGTQGEHGKVLDSHVRVIYGEGVTLDNIGNILEAITKAGYSIENVILGVGAYVYSILATRDTFAQAVKAQSVTINGKETEIYKAPYDRKYPDSGENAMKKSHKGYVVVKDNGNTVVDGYTSEEEAKETDNELHTIFKDGKTYNEVTFDEVRARIDKSI